MPATDYDKALHGAQMIYRLELAVRLGLLETHLNSDGEECYRFTARGAAAGRDNFAALVEEQVDEDAVLELARFIYEETED